MYGHFLCPLHPAPPRPWKLILGITPVQHESQENWNQYSPKSLSLLIHDHNNCFLTLLFPNCLCHRTTALRETIAFEYYSIKWVTPNVFCYLPPLNIWTSLFWSRQLPLCANLVTDLILLLFLTLLLGEPTSNCLFSCETYVFSKTSRNNI